MAVLWTSSSCFFPSRFPSLLRVAFFVPSTEHSDCMPCCPYVVCRIVVILRISRYWAYWWYCRMDLTWYDRSDVMTDVVTELGPLLRHVRDRPDRAVGRVSRSRLSTSSRPLLPCTILLSATESTCSSMAWGSTVFGVAGLVIYFEGRKVVQWVLAHWLVLSCIHSLEPTKTSQATPGVSVARLVPWVMSQLTSRGGADPSLRRSLEFKVSSLSPARRQDPLGSS